ncbi:MAG: hypothetical protein HY863_15760 [Chloroflexi bacterium]|nr:hypothetical protein [Chloroflexota bacterium]
MADIKIEGIEDLVNKLSQLGGGAEDALADGLFAGAFVMEGFVKVTIQQSGKSGRTYQRGGGKAHQASAPGEAPAIDYGHLINSIASARDGKGAIVYSNAEHAPKLEFGTARMAARPFMRKAADEHSSEILNAIETTTRRKVEGDAG